jgi:hypothetical protein
MFDKDSFHQWSALFFALDIFFFFCPLPIAAGSPEGAKNITVFSASSNFFAKLQAFCCSLVAAG